MPAKRLLCSVLLSVLLVAVVPAGAQVDYATATLKGTVYDPGGLLIEHATATIENASTGFTKKLQTGGDGAFQFLLLQPGSYRLKVEANGFTTTTATVTLFVGQAITHDVHMKIGSMRDTVEVTGEAAMVQVEQTQQANLIDIKQISELPNLTRSFTDSVFTLPGVSKSEAPRAQNPGFSGFQSSGFSIGGSNGRNNLVTLDGGEGDYGSGQLRTPHVPVDSIQEFQVNRSSFAAEFGFTTGTAINLITKGGTNAFHGSAYAYYHNETTDAANYFAPKLAHKATEQSFIPGVTFGGPIIKNKLFFFTAFEYQKLDPPQFRSYTTDVAAQGINSNPAQQAYVAAIPDPLLAAKVRYMLTPSNFPNVNKLLIPNTGVFNDWKRFYNLVTRVDYQPSTNDSLTFRFSFMRDNASRMNVLDPLNSPDDATIQYWDDYTLLGSWNHVFNERLVNQLRVQVVPLDKADVEVAAPNTAYLRIGSLGQFRGEHYEPYYARQHRFQFEDSVTWIKGRHSFKFGASYRPMSYHVEDHLWFGGEFQFLDGAIPLAALGLPPSTDPATNLSGIQAYALGLPVAFRQGFGNPVWEDWGHYLGVYAQDSWKLGHNVTLDFGGRIDYDAEPAPLPHHVYFSPRLGIAWNPDGKGKTVIRAGGGIFVAPVNFFIDYIVNLLDGSGRYINQAAAILTDTKTPSSAVVWGYGLKTGKLPFGQLTQADLAAIGLPIPAQTNRVILQPSENYENPYAVQASLGVQRELTRYLSLEVAYQMYHGVHIQTPYDGSVKETSCKNLFGPTSPDIHPFIGPCYAQIDPTLGLAQREIYSSYGSSIYHGMTSSVRWRSRSLQFQANYTFSRTIDDNTDFNNDFMPYRPTRRNLERAVSAFNISHNFVASAVYALPFKAGQGNVLSSIFSDMTVSPIVNIRSGIPFTVRVPGMSNANGTKLEFLYARPWAAGRNTGIGPGYQGVDLRVTKSLFIRRDSGVKLDLLVEGTNIFNHANFSAVNDVFPANPNLALGNGGYLGTGPYNVHGYAASDRSQSLAFKSAFDPRQVQFGVKFVFYPNSPFAWGRRLSPPAALARSPWQPPSSLRSWPPCPTMLPG